MYLPVHAALLDCGADRLEVAVHPGAVDGAPPVLQPQLDRGDRGVAVPPAAEPGGAEADQRHLYRPALQPHSVHACQRCPVQGDLIGDLCRGRPI